MVARDQRGFVLLLLPFLLMALLPLLALVVHAGLIITMKHQLQAAADAGAVAAVSATTYVDRGLRIEKVIDPPRAEREARTLVQRNIHAMGLDDHPYRKVTGFRFRALDDRTVRVDLEGEVYLPFTKFLADDPWKKVHVFAEAELRDRGMK